MQSNTIDATAIRARVQELVARDGRYATARMLRRKASTIQNVIDGRAAHSTLLLLAEELGLIGPTTSNADTSVKSISSLAGSMRLGTEPMVP